MIGHSWRGRDDPAEPRFSSISLRFFLLVVSSFLACLPLAAQENHVVRVGVALLQTAPGMPGAEARDRVVKLLSQRKPDKNLSFTLEVIALDAPSMAKSLAEAREKNCEFVLYAHVSDLSTTSTLSDDMYLPVFHATMEYQLNRAIDGSGFALRSVEVEDSSSTRGALLRVLSKLANSAWAEVESGQGTADAPAVAGMQGNTTVPSLMQYVNPRAYCSWLPSDVVHADALRGACEYAISLPEKMPNFVCGQQTARYRGASRAPVDLISATVRYEDGHESYENVRVNDRALSGGVEGLHSTGEFGGNIRAIFDRKNRGQFSYGGEDKIGDRAAFVFIYQIAEQNEPLWVLHAPDQMLSPPYSGQLWIDAADGRVLRFRSETKGLPLTFPMREVELQIDYDTVAFGDGTNFVLPVESTLTNVYNGQEPSRNVEQFRDCHKFRARGRLVLNSEPGASEPAPAAQVPPSAAALQKDMDESEAMFAAIRDQTLQEAEVRSEAEQRKMLAIATGAALEKIAALRTEQQHRLAQRQAIAANSAGATGAAPQTKLRVDVRLVLVSAVPRDNKGNVVGGLRQDNFRLFDEGKPQIIKHFSMEGTRSVSAREPETAAPIFAPSTVVSPAPSTVAPSSNLSAEERATAYLFDDVHLDSADLAYARDAAERHFSSLQAGERAALFTTSGAVVVDFTHDRDELFAALRKLKPQAMIPESDCPPISYYMADLMVNKADAEARDLAVAEAADCATRGGPPSRLPDQHAQHLAVSKAAEVVNTGNVESRNTLAALKNVVRRTAALPGQRSIVLVSPGFLAPTPDTQQDMMEIVDHAAGAGIVINALDAGGLHGSGPAANVGDPQFDVAEAQARSDVMAEVASGTGGIFFHNNNNLDEGFRRTADAPGYVYLLGFSPQKLDGKFHKLKVTLNGAGNFEVQARRGYYALKPPESN